MDKLTSFKKTIEKHNLRLERKTLSTLQVNMGKLCNQVCHHCHVDAGPKRTEIMDKRTVDRLLLLLRSAPQVKTVDVTGGAPELNPHFKDFVSQVRHMGKEVIDRCNLTVLFEPGQEDTAEFLREYRVQIVSSLPCYSAENVDKQRGNGVFAKSIRALQKLNELGFGKEGTGLVLNLVYNPLGAFLPPEQNGLEEKYKKELKEHFNIEFNQLLTITNMPIHRFLKDLKRQGKDQEYRELLINNFNVHAAQAVMCRDLISISWDGFIYDCDFNQMLELPAGSKKRSIWDINSFHVYDGGSIAFADHCYGCTAGAGSSCGGSLVIDN